VQFHQTTATLSVRDRSFHVLVALLKSFLSLPANPYLSHTLEYLAANYTTSLAPATIAWEHKVVAMCAIFDQIMCQWGKPRGPMGERHEN
jgi:hypothetical protein